MKRDQLNGLDLGEKIEEIISMTLAVASAEEEIRNVLRDADEPMQLGRIIEEVQRRNVGLLERDIRPAFWMLASAGEVEVDQNFLATLPRETSR